MACRLRATSVEREKYRQIQCIVTEREYRDILAKNIVDGTFAKTLQRM
jgi:hypothetical protein